MKSRSIHKIVGLVLILPMLGWTITGLIFFLKPGYQGAYEQLSLKTYPLEKPFSLPSSSEWKEVKLLKTILGYHLLVKANGKTQHLDPTSLVDKPLPTNSQYRMLLVDAFSKNKERYGEVIHIDNILAETNTGISIKLDWDNLTLTQKGQDTQLIGLLYKIHYLQWTPFNGINTVLGGMGLLLLITLTAFGVRIYFSKKQ